MKLNNYFDSELFITYLSTIISFGLQNKYSYQNIEKRIIDSDYLNKIVDGYDLYLSEDQLLKETYKDSLNNFDYIHIFVEAEWMSYSYEYLLSKTNYNIEFIFTYLPIKTMLEMFPLYHEMDYSQVLDRLLELIKDKSLINIIMNKYKYSVKDISERSGLSKSMIYQLCSREKDASKLNLKQAVMLSEILNINPKTLLFN